MRSKRCLYQGQSLLYLGIVEVFVRKIYINGQKVPSALFSVHSKPIFRSAASRFILGIQISSEMSGLDHDASGDISWGKVLAFLKELFDRWRVISATHMVSIVLYTRLEYSTDRSPPTKEPQNIHPDDYYRVVSSEMPSSDCRDILPRMTSEYKSFLRDIMIRSSNVSSIPEVRGRPSAAIAGNFLEAVNVAVSACLYNDTDLDFIRTGASILMITAGPAMFHANEQLLRVTTDRLLARSIGVELVSLSQKPTHTAPLLKLREDSSSNVNRGKEKESYVVPSWLEISFYEGPKAMSNSSPDVLAYDTEPPNGMPGFILHTSLVIGQRGAHQSRLSTTITRRPNTRARLRRRILRSCRNRAYRRTEDGQTCLAKADSFQAFVRLGLYRLSFRPFLLQISKAARSRSSIIPIQRWSKAARLERVAYLRWTCLSNPSKTTEMVDFDHSWMSTTTTFIYPEIRCNDVPRQSRLLKILCTLLQCRC